MRIENARSDAVRFFHLDAFSSAEVRIAVRQVSRCYGQILGVSDVTLSLGRGLYGLLGPNGAGKWSLVKMCVGLLPTSRGKVQVLGGEPFTDAEVRRRIPGAST